MSALLEAPAPRAAKPSAPAAGAGAPLIGVADRSSANDPANLTGPALTSALARSSRSRRGGAPEAQGKTESPNPNGPAPAASNPAPAEAVSQGTDNTNAASPPASAEGEETQHDPNAAATVEALEAEAEQAEAGAEDHESEDPKAESKGTKALQKRVAKLTARLKAYEARFGTVDGAQPDQPARPAPVVSEVDHPEIAKIDQEIATYESHLAWFDQNPDGGEYRDSQGRLLGTFEPARIPAMRRAAERRVAELAARRATRVDRMEADRETATRQADAEAVERYPWLNDPEAPEHQQASAILAGLPRNVVASLQGVPNARLLLGALVEGMRTQKPASRPAPAARPTPPKVMAPAATAAPRSGPQESLKAQLTEAEAAFEKSGSTVDHTRVLKLRRQLRTAA